jgi:hypothetical protein
MNADDPDASFLMWDIRRNLHVDKLPREQVIIHFKFSDAKKGKRMRHLLGWCALLPMVAFAQAPQGGWKPSKPAEFVVSAAPGGANDRLARAIQRIVQDGQLAPFPLNVVSKPGGGGSIAIVYLNTHAGDAHHITLASSAWMSTVAGGRSTVTHRDVTPIVKLHLATNYWSADFMGQRDAADFMEHTYQSFRRALLEIGMAK